MSTAAPPSSLQSLERLFGFDAFRTGQQEAVEAALGGRDALVVMPTGAGKSLCYQLPALSGLGFTLVVSPLVALMRDQVAGLRPIAGDAVRDLSSHSTAEEAQATLDDVRAGRVRLLYVAPERFASSRFRAALHGIAIDLFVVDEAHCVSEWGHDFRPDYWRLAAVRDELGARATMALTATATPRVAADIARRLALRDPVEVRTGFDRPNLTFDVLEAGSERERLKILRSALADPAMRPAVIYARSRKAVDKLAGELGALAYHAGLSAETRSRTQDRFMASADDVIVCTNAFGMGVDKADVRSVWHWNLPNSLEAYYQEAGRAGRDGLPSRCVLLYSASDRGLIGRFIVQARFGSDDVDRLLTTLAAVADPETKEFAAAPDELARSAAGGGDQVRALLAAAEAVGAIELAPGAGSVWRGSLRLRALGASRRQEVQARAKAVERTRWEQLDAAQGYAEADSCRRDQILAYFGDRSAGAPQGRCCDVCSPPPEGAMRSAPAPTDLVAAVVEVAATAAPSVGRSGIDGILRGTDQYRDRFGTHPLFASCTRLRVAQLKVAISEALASGAVEQTDGRYPVIVPAGQSARSGPRVASAPSTPLRVELPDDVDEALVERLRTLRSDAARRRGIAPFMVYSNRTMLAIAAERPASDDELLAISGVGPKLLAQHGDEILAAVRGSD